MRTYTVLSGSTRKCSQTAWREEFWDDPASFTHSGSGGIASTFVVRRAGRVLNGTEPGDPYGM